MITRFLIENEATNMQW